MFKTNHNPLLFILFISIVIVSGCDGDTENTPQVSLVLDKNTITINDGQISEFITATITRLDDNNENAVFILKFPEDKNNFYATNVDGDKIREISTKAIKGKNSLDTLQFKVYGSLEESTESKYDLKTELWWNNTRIESQNKTIKIIVK